MIPSQLFRALGDPTRIEIIQRLSSGQSFTLTTISQGLQITRQGARKHVQILSDAKLITLEPQGRDTTVQLNPKTLEQGKKFIEHLEHQWEKRLESLRRFVDND
jgi:DNA-binding transcriptional ArsR family regulator